MTTPAPVTLRRLRALTVPEVEEALGWPRGDAYDPDSDQWDTYDPSGWAHQCHAVSAAIVRSGLFEPGTCRVARGSCIGVGGQHSWVVFGDPYDEHVLLLDATLWSYDPDAPVLHVQRGYRGSNDPGRWRYRPKGWGSHWATGIPVGGTDEDVTPAGLDRVQDPGSLLDLFREHSGGTLDRRWWAQFLNGPIGGWPARRWLPLIASDPRLAALVPVDLLGMATDLNPGDLYMHPADPRLQCSECHGTAAGCMVAPVKCCPDCTHTAAAVATPQKEGSTP
jgi:hypothetical protein